MLSASKTRIVPLLVLITASVFFAYDIVSDVMAGDENTAHIIIEFIVFVAVSLVLFRELRRLRLMGSVLNAERERAARLSGELYKVMIGQFDDWELSPSEAEIALLLIKGLSMKEIAEAREVKEKTIRQQATKIYSKSGYSGRHELAAHFIEDLMAKGTS